MIKNAKLISVDTDPREYFKNDLPRGHKDFPVSSSMLRQLAHCPARWRAGYNPPDTEAKDYGSLLDCRLLTPNQFEDRYAIQPAKYTTAGMECPVCKTVTDSKKCMSCKTERVEIKVEKDWSNNSTTCSTWTSQQLLIGKDIVTAGELSEADFAIQALLRDDAISTFIRESQRQVYLTYEWHDSKTHLIVPGRVMIDLVPSLTSEFCKCLGDLKTCRTAALIAFQRDCFSRGYFIQAALYRDVWMEAHPDEDRNTYCLIIQENYPPWQPGKRMISQDFMEFGTAEYRRLHENYCQCLKSDKWPSYDDTDEAAQGWSIVSAEPWMQNQVAFAPKFEFGETLSVPEPDDDQGIIP